MQSETFGAILHDIADSVKAVVSQGKQPNAYHLGQVNQYTKQLQSESSPTLFKMTVGLLYHHLDKIGKEK